MRVRKRTVVANPAGEMTLVEHLVELRHRLIVSVVAIAIGGIVAFVLYPQILDVLKAPYCDVVPKGRSCDLVAIDPLVGFRVRLQIAGYGGLVLALPVVLWQLWRFITPGLQANERKYAVPFVLSSVVLFLLGAGLALATFPQALRFLQQVGGFEPLYTPDKYLSLITLMMLAFGAGFEFPVVLVALQLVGVLSPARLRGWRRPAIVIIFVVAAVITPSGDPYTLLAMALPMAIFYEVSILIGRLARR